MNADQAIAAAARGGAIVAALVVLAPALAWVEARVQARVAGRPGRRRPWPRGLSAPLASLVASLTKGEAAGTRGDRPLRTWSPLAALLAGVLAFAAAALALPPGPASGAAADEGAAGLLALLVAGACLTHGLALSGPGGGVWHLTAAGVRALVAQSGALVAWGLCMVALCTAHGTVGLAGIALGQARLLGPAPMWNVWMQPVGFAVYLVTCLAMSLRPPFAPGDSSALGGGLAGALSGPRQVLGRAGGLAFTLGAALAGAHLYLGGPHGFGSSGAAPAGAAVLAVKALVVAGLLSLLSAGLPRLTGRGAARAVWRWLVPAAVLNLLWAGLLAAFAT